MGGSVRIGSRFRNCLRTIHMRRSRLRFGGGRGDGLRRPLDDPLTDSAAPAEMNGYRARATGPHLTPWAAHILLTGDTGGQSTDSGLSVRFCLTPEEIRDGQLAGG